MFQRMLMFSLLYLTTVYQNNRATTGDEMPMAVKTDFDSTVINQAFDTTYVNSRRLPNTD